MNSDDKHGLNSCENSTNWNKNPVRVVSIHHDFFFFHLFDFFSLAVFFPLSVDMRAILPLSISSFPCVSPLPFCPVTAHPFFHSLLTSPSISCLSFPLFFSLSNQVRHNIHKLDFNYHLAHFIKFVNWLLKRF